MFDEEERQNRQNINYYKVACCHNCKNFDNGHGDYKSDCKGGFGGIDAENDGICDNYVSRWK